eukprot:675404-Rhodomonas_salina.1
MSSRSREVARAEAGWDRALRLGQREAAGTTRAGKREASEGGNVVGRRLSDSEMIMITGADVTVYLCAMQRPVLTSLSTYVVCNAQY